MTKTLQEKIDYIKEHPYATAYNLDKAIQKLREEILMKHKEIVVSGFNNQIKKGYQMALFDILALIGEKK